MSDDGSDNMVVNSEEEEKEEEKEEEEENQSDSNENDKIEKTEETKNKKSEKNKQIEKNEEEEEIEENEQIEGNEENEENEEESEISEKEEEVEIDDPIVKKLLEFDISNYEEIKDEIIETLMEDTFLIQNDLNKKDKFNNVDSTVKNYISGNLPKKKYDIPKKKKNENLVYDFDEATLKVYNKLSENEKESEVMKLLFPEGINSIKQKPKKKEINKEEITEKINQALQKKQEDIERIATKCNEEYNEKHTFTPMINKTNDDKRNFEQFLENEKTHLQKAKDKINNIKQAEEIQKRRDITLRPKINKNSEKIIKSKNNTNEEVYVRLYNKRNQSAKKVAEKENEKFDKLQNKIKKDTKNDKNKNQTKQRANTVNSKKEFKIPEKPKPTIEKKEIPKKYLLLDKDISNNKIFLNAFEEHFKTISNNFNNNNEEKKEEETNKRTKKNIELIPNKFTSPQLNEFLYQLGMISNKPVENNENNPVVESILQQDEKKLINQLYESLKNDDDTVDNDKLLKFLISVLGLSNYDLYRQFKSNHQESEISNLISDKTSKDEKLEIMINKQNSENESKINKDNKKDNKYVSFDNDNKLIIPINKSKLIRRDFQLFKITYMSSRTNLKKKDKVKEEKYNFKPNINQKSEIIYEKYKEKMNTLKEENKEENQNNPHMDYIERLFLQKKKHQAEQEKLREENLKKEMEACTFKPKTNNLSSITKATGANRFNELFHKGSEKEKNRKNKTKEEIELEKYGSECTFKPNINNEAKEKTPETHFTNDIYGEKSYRLLYERLRNGRMERLVKDAVNDRYGLDDVLKDFVKKNKENNPEERDEERSSEEQSENNNDNKESENNESDENNNNENKDDNKTNDNNEDGKDEEEKKDGIPLLIIDVNIRQGVKKKIYVYEGDTPEGLADKFAEEHNLEPETKEKLQSLIQSHMLRLLTRIDEENQSLSEKSQNNNHPPPKV